MSMHTSQRAAYTLVDMSLRRRPLRFLVFHSNVVPFAAEQGPTVSHERIPHFAPELFFKLM